MDGLSGWLRQIIAVVLLASLIDLLLPNRTMQRYVRLVAGLFILMTVATPVLGWMKGDFGSKLAAGLDSAGRSPEGSAGQLAMIEREGLKLRERQSEQAANLAVTRLEANIRQAVEETEDRGVEDVSVTTERGADGSWAVTGVVVTLEPDGESLDSTEGGSTSVKEVAPIADVDIRVNVDGWTDSAGEADSKEASSVPEQGEKAGDDERRRVSALLAGRFGIDAGIVEVLAAPGAGEKK